MANARAKSEQAEQSAIKSEQDSDHARIKAKEYAPEFHQPGIIRYFMNRTKFSLYIMKIK
jgi:junctophilin